MDLAFVQFIRPNVQNNMHHELSRANQAVAPPSGAGDSSHISDPVGAAGTVTSDPSDL